MERRFEDVKDRMCIRTGNDSEDRVHIRLIGTDTTLYTEIDMDEAEHLRDWLTKVLNKNGRE